MSFDFKPNDRGPVELQQGPNPGIGKFNIFLFVSFALLLLTVFTWKPLSAAFKGAWARQSAREALTALATEDFGHAISRLMTARDWAPNDPEVLHAFITYLKTVEANPAELAHHLRLLAEQQPLAVEDQILYGATLLTLGSTAEARSIYDNLPPPVMSSADGLSFFSKLRAAEGQTAEAGDIARQALQLQKDSPEARLEIAIQHSRHTYPEFRRRSWQDLWELTKLNTKTGLDAALALAKDSRLNFREAQGLLTLVESHPYSTLIARLAVISALILLQPALTDQLIQQEVTRFQTTKNGSLIEIAGWLSEHQQHAQLLKLIPSNLADGSRPLYTCVIKALAGQGRWQELKAMLTTRRPPVSVTLAKIWMADAESHLQPNLDESRRLLAFAVDAAIVSKESEELELASGLSYKLGMLDLALKAHLGLVTLLPARQGELLQRTREIAMLTKDTRTVLEVSRQLQKLHPTNGIYADQLTYFRLLLGEEMEQVDLAALKKTGALDDATASTNKVQRIPVSLLEALAAFRFSDREAVLKHVLRLPVTDGLPAGHRAVLAGLLATTGKPDRAFQIAEKIPASLLLDEERSFLKLAQ